MTHCTTVIPTATQQGETNTPRRSFGVLTAMVEKRTPLSAYVDYRSPFVVAPTTALAVLAAVGVHRRWIRRIAHAGDVTSAQLRRKRVLRGRVTR